MRCICSYYDHGYGYGYDYSLGPAISQQYIVTNIVVRKMRIVPYPGRPNNDRIEWYPVATAATGTYNVTHPESPEMPTLKHITAEGPGVTILEPLRIGESIDRVEFIDNNGRHQTVFGLRVLRDASPGDNEFAVGNI